MSGGFKPKDVVLISDGHPFAGGCIGYVWDVRDVSGATAVDVVVAVPGHRGSHDDLMICPPEQLTRVGSMPGDVMEANL